MLLSFTRRVHKLIYLLWLGRIEDAERVKQAMWRASLRKRILIQTGVTIQIQGPTPKETIEHRQLDKSMINHRGVQANMLRSCRAFILLDLPEMRETKQKEDFFFPIKYINLLIDIGEMMIVYRVAIEGTSWLLGVYSSDFSLFLLSGDCSSWDICMFCPLLKEKIWRQSLHILLAFPEVASQTMLKENKNHRNAIQLPTSCEGCMWCGFEGWGCRSCDSNSC